MTRETQNQLVCDKIILGISYKITPFIPLYQFIVHESKNATFDL